MIRQYFALPRWNWTVEVFYEVDRLEAESLLRKLEDAGCHGENMERADKALHGSRYDFGITYSNHREGHTIMILGKSSSASEFQNSLDHEKGHLSKHVCLTRSIDPFGEEAEYLAGEIGQKLFKVARHFLCEGCRRRRIKGS